MTNKEFRVKIYGWLFNEFGIKFEDLTHQKTKGLKTILKEFNPTQEVAKPQPIKKEIKPVKPKYDVRVWREGMD